MGKTWLILAPVIVAAAVIWGAVWVGIGIGRVREATARQGIDPQWAADVQRLLRELLLPPKSDAMAADFVVLPRPLKSRTHQLLAASERAGAGVGRRR
jgi:hypothetical protein